MILEPAPPAVTIRIGTRAFIRLRRVTYLGLFAILTAAIMTRDTPVLIIIAVIVAAAAGVLAASMVSLFQAMNRGDTE